MRWSFESVASVSALVLSLGGVATSVVQTRVMLQQQRATLWPHLAEITSATQAASDHAAVWVDLSI